jgi:hypothetical protein
MLSAIISKVLVVMLKHVTTLSSLFGVTMEGGMLGVQGPCEVLAFYVPSVISHSVTSPSISSSVCQMQHQHMIFHGYSGFSIRFCSRNRARTLAANHKLLLGRESAAAVYAERPAPLMGVQLTILYYRVSCSSYKSGSFQLANHR